MRDSLMRKVPEKYHLTLWQPGQQKEPVKRGVRIKASDPQGSAPGVAPLTVAPEDDPVPEEEKKALLLSQSELPLPGHEASRGLAAVPAHVGEVEQHC